MMHHPINEISTPEAFGRVLRHPRLYGFLSLLLQFRISCPVPEEYEVLASALQIRSRRQRLTRIYDSACDRIDAYNDSHGLNCVFHNSRCGIPPKAGRLNGCCYQCRYQSSSGCPTRNLTCKFYFCDRMLPLRPLTWRDFPEFRILSLRQQYMLRNNPYCTREVFLRLLNFGSILLFLLYSTRKVFDMELADRKNRKEEARHADGNRSA